MTEILPDPYLYLQLLEETLYYYVPIREYLDEEFSRSLDITLLESFLTGYQKAQVPLTKSANL